MRATEVPVVDSSSCTQKLRATRLGKAFILDSSFICAGGEAAKDA
jgi:hypothetical protein